jgi:hypothetical protein
MHRRNAMAMVISAVLLVGAPLTAQEDDVKRDFLAMVEVWNAQDGEGFCRYVTTGFWGFYVGGDGMLQQRQQACDPVATQAGFDAGHDPSAEVRDLIVKVHGDFATIACYLEGEIQLSPESVLSGAFRYTGTLVNDGGTWKTVQYHFSPLDPK